jgi:hypothetical protein
VVALTVRLVTTYGSSFLEVDGQVLYKKRLLMRLIISLLSLRQTLEAVAELMAKLWMICTCLLSLSRSMVLVESLGKQA